MDKLAPKAARDITEPGAYEWLDIDGVMHIGFINKDSRGRLHGSFVSVEGSSRAIAVTYSNERFCDGQFYGPLALQSAGVKQTIFDGGQLPQPGNKIRFKKDIISTAEGRRDEVWAKEGETGKIIGTERPGNIELFWVESSQRPAFQLYMKDFEVVS